MALVITPKYNSTTNKWRLFALSKDNVKLIYAIGKECDTEEECLLQKKQFKRDKEKLMIANDKYEQAKEYQELAKKVVDKWVKERYGSRASSMNVYINFDEEQIEFLYSKDYGEIIKSGVIPASFLIDDAELSEFARKSRQDEKEYEDKKRARFEHLKSLPEVQEWIRLEKESNIEY